MGIGLRRFGIRAHGWRRSPRWPYFLCLCKESKQRKHTPAVRPPQSGGCAVPAGIFVRAILAHTKTAHVLCAAPLGFDPPGLPDLRGPEAASDTSVASSLPLLSPLPLGPLEARRVGRVKPEGRRHGWRRFRMAQGCALRKFPARSRTRSAQRGGRAAWGVFLWSFLCTSKERTPPRRAAPCPHAGKPDPIRPRNPKRWRALRTRSRSTTATDFVVPHPTPLSHRDFLRSPQGEGLELREDGCRGRPHGEQHHAKTKPIPATRHEPPHGGTGHTCHPRLLPHRATA
jgi:hypothetical protein